MSRVKSERPALFQSLRLFPFHLSLDPHMLHAVKLEQDDTHEIDPSHGSCVS